MKRSVMGLAACALLAAAPLVQAQDAPRVTITPEPAADDIAPASARQSVRAAGRTVSYQASWSKLVLTNEAGAPQATISATSYVRNGVRDRARRPVVIAFNGGPGASSTPLHFGVLGPRRMEGPRATRRIVDNPETLVDAADVVMIDPVGTGFSRILTENGGAAYFTPRGDADAALRFIHDWLRTNNREASPIYIVGESYGGFRLAEMAASMSDLNIAGLVMVSPGLEFSRQGDWSYVFDLPSMAAAAHAHGKVGAGRTVQQVYEEARAFALDDYAAALALGWELTDVQRTQVAARMAELTGLSADFIASENLRVSSQDFLDNLMPGQVVGRTDTRVAAPAPSGALVQGRSRAADDPALGLGASNVIRSPLAREYLANEIGVRTELDYLSLTLDVNFSWNWNSGSPQLGRNMGFSPLSNVATLMREKPNVRFLLIAGYYDLATPVLAQTYALTHAELPQERVQMMAFAGPHAPYEGSNELAAVSRALHDFVTAH